MHKVELADLEIQKFHHKILPKKSDVVIPFGSLSFRLRCVDSVNGPDPVNRPDPVNHPDPVNRPNALAGS